MFVEGRIRPRENTAEEIIALATEFLPGGRRNENIEYFSTITKDWTPMSYNIPAFDFNNYTYRVKPC